MISKSPLNIKDTQKGLLEKDFSAVELVEYYLNRIDKFDKGLNSFITITEEVAYGQAKKIDEVVAELGEEALVKHPLLGVTVAYKDMFLTQGVRTTAASNVLKDYVPAYSATVVNRLQKAGCLMIGKTNQDAWAHGSSGENSDFGPTINPWNKKYVPGGSSSGSAAALAANMSLITTGTDTCGSIRLPANFCGIVGLKPTYGSVSRYGVVAMASSLDSIGHFGRTVDDVQKVYDVSKGVDGRDSTLSESDYKLKKGKIKIGVPKEFFDDGLDEEVEKSIIRAISDFKDNNIEFVDVSLPHTKYAIGIYYIIQPAEVSSNLGRYDGVRYGSDRTAFGDEAKRRIMLGTYVLSAGYYDAYYNKAMKIRTIIRDELDSVYKKVDALIAPVSPTPAFKLGEKSQDPLKMYLSDVFAATANLTGTPGIAIPSGLAKSGLPLGFQLMGPRFSEPLLFKLGKLYQSVTDHHLKLPTL